MEYRWSTEELCSALFIAVASSVYNQVLFRNIFLLLPSYIYCSRFVCHYDQPIFNLSHHNPQRDHSHYCLGTCVLLIVWIENCRICSTIGTRQSQCNVCLRTTEVDDCLIQQIEWLLLQWQETLVQNHMNEVEYNFFEMYR